MVLMICHEEGLLGGTHFSIDGLKLSSNASKEWSGKFDDLKKNKRRLGVKLSKLSKNIKRQTKKSAASPQQTKCVMKSGLKN